MSPRGLGDPHRWRAFLAETAGDAWWEREEAALAHAIATTDGGELPTPANPIVVNVADGTLHLSRLPQGWTLIVGDVVYVPRPIERAGWLRRAWALLARWVGR